MVFTLSIIDIAKLHQKFKIMPIAVTAKCGSGPKWAEVGRSAFLITYSEVC